MRVTDMPGAATVWNHQTESALSNKNVVQLARAADTMTLQV